MNSLPGLLLSSLKKTYSHPLFPAASVVLMMAMTLLSALSSSVETTFTTTLGKSIWLGAFIILSIALGSFILSGMTGIAAAVLKKQRAGMSTFMHSASRHWWRNVQGIVLLLLAGAAVQFIALQVARLAIPMLGGNGARLFLFFLLIAGMLGFLLFLTFTTFYTVLNQKGAWQAMQKSRTVVKRHYLEVLALMLTFFVLIGILGELQARSIISTLIADAINALFLFPWLIFSLVMFAIEHDDI